MGPRKTGGLAQSLENVELAPPNSPMKGQPMNEDKFEDTAHDLAARLLAIEVGVVALMRAHPNPALLALSFEQTKEAALANLLTLPWAEQHLQAFHRTTQVLAERIPHR